MAASSNEDFDSKSNAVGATQLSVCDTHSRRPCVDDQTCLEIRGIAVCAQAMSKSTQLFVFRGLAMIITNPQKNPYVNAIFPKKPSSVNAYHNFLLIEVQLTEV